MKFLASCLARALARFARNRRGVAVIEFALVVPIMLTLYVGAMEASLLLTIDRKVQSVAGSLGDLVARTDSYLSKEYLRDYFQASVGIMTPYSNTDVKQLVTLIEVKTDGTTSVRWSREYLNGHLTVGTTHLKETSYRLPEAMIEISQNNVNNFVVASEVSTTYKPFSGLVFDKAIPLYRENFYLPRNGKFIDIDPTVN